MISTPTTPVTGSHGSGKSTLIRQMLRQIQDCGQAAIVLDVEGESTMEFYDQSRGYVILNPHDVRCPFWSPWLEFRLLDRHKTLVTWHVRQNIGAVHLSAMRQASPLTCRSSMRLEHGLDVRLHHGLGLARSQIVKRRLQHEHCQL
jgi:hypothetical protein